MRGISVTIITMFLAIITTAAMANVFKGDRLTRRPMTNEEKKSSIKIGDCCSGVLIAADLILTAYHCPKNEEGKPAVRGSSLYDAQENGFTVIGQPLNHSPALGDDFQITKIQWDKGELPAELKLVKSIARDKEFLNYGTNQEASKIYTLGIPRDKDHAATYAEGFAKHINIMGSYKIHFLDINIGTTYCNSGGGIYDSESDTLVGLVRGGTDPTFEFGQIVLADPEDSAAWNWGNQSYRLYKQSPILQEIFPDGQSIYSKQ